MNGISPDSTGALNFSVVTSKLQVPGLPQPGRTCIAAFLILAVCGCPAQEAELPTRPSGSTLTPDGHGDRSGGVFAAAEILAFVDLSTNRVWLVTREEIVELAQQHASGKYHFFMATDPSAHKW
jgi:hypothetical protein